MNTDRPGNDGTPQLEVWLAEEAALNEVFSALVMDLELTSLREKQIAAQGFTAGQRFAELKRSAK